MFSPRRDSLLKSLSLKITRLAARGDLASSLKEADRLTRLEPDLGWVLFYRASLRLCLGDRRGVQEDLLALQSVSPDRLFAAGRELEIPEAAAGTRFDATMRTLLASNPGLVWGPILESYRRRCRRDWEGSRRCVSRALRLSSRNAALWGLAARIGYVARLPGSSAAAMEKAHRLAPECFWINAWLGEVRRYAGDWKGAERFLDKALRLNPRYYIAYSWRGSVRRILGSPRKAVADLDIALKHEFIEEDDKASLAWAYHERSLAKRVLGDYAGAFRDLNNAHRLNSRYVWAQQDGRPGTPSGEDSMELLDRIIARHPRSAWALAWRGHSLGAVGRTSLAREDLNRALSLRPALSWAHAWRAGADLDENLRKSAMASLRRSIRLDPRYAVSRLFHGKFLIANGRFRNAERELSDSLKQDPFCAEAWRQRALAARGLGRYRRAEDFHRRAVELDPGSDAAKA